MTVGGLPSSLPPEYINLEESLSLPQPPLPKSSNHAAPNGGHEAKAHKGSKHENVLEQSGIHFDYITQEVLQTISKTSIANKAPMPKPRIQMTTPATAASIGTCAISVINSSSSKDTAKNVTNANRKKPIPQP